MSSRSSTQDDNKVLLKLRHVRREKGLSISSLAKEAGVDKQKIGRIERGETQVTVDMLQQLAKVLDVPPSVLLENTNVNFVEEQMSKENRQISVKLIPIIYERIDKLCEKNCMEIDNSAKVHLSTEIFNVIQDIQSTPQSDEELVKLMFRAFDRIFERFLLLHDHEPDAD